MDDMHEPATNGVDRTHSPSQVIRRESTGRQINQTQHALAQHMQSMHNVGSSVATAGYPAAQYSTEATPLPAAHEQEENSTYTYTAHILQYVQIKQTQLTAVAG